MKFKILGYHIRINEPCPPVNKPEWMTFEKQHYNKFITNYEFRDIIRELVEGTLFTYMMDRKYKCVDIRTLRKWLQVEKTDEIGYIANDHDCDDFAVSLHGHLNDWDSTLATAIASVRIKETGELHAMNLVIGLDGRVYLIEPQNDNLFVDAQGYDIEKVFAL